MAMFLVRRTTPPFDALYALPPAVPSRPSILATVTTEPRWPSSRAGCDNIWPMTCLAVRNVPVRLTAITRAHSCEGSMCTGPPPATPAAFTSPSTVPPKPMAARTSWATDASSATATREKSHRSPPPPPAPPGAAPGPIGIPDEIGAHDPSPLVQEPRRRGPPDARGRSRHDVGPAVQSAHDASNGRLVALGQPGLIGAGHSSSPGCRARDRRPPTNYRSPTDHPLIVPGEPTS